MATTEVETTDRPVGDDAAPPDRTGPRPRRGTRLLPVLVPLLLVVAAGLLRFVDLGDPTRLYFDEVYYAEDAQQYLDQGVEATFAVHPPVGKWLIAGGIAAAGDDSFGWRVAAALAGTLLVGATYLLGRHLVAGLGGAALAGFLVTVDGLALVQSRISMLDIFLGLFVALGLWLLLVDLGRRWSRVDDRVPPAEDRDDLDEVRVPRTGTGWRLAAGLVLGLAVATKWSGGFALAGAVLVALLADLALRRRTTGRLFAEPARLVGGLVLPFVVVPAVVYVGSYAGWFANYEETRLGQERCEEAEPCEFGPGDVVADWWRDQLDIARFHDSLEAEHAYRASPATWFLLQRPVAYYYEDCDADRASATPGQTDEDGEEITPCRVPEGRVAEILAVGNPVVWWLALAAYPLLGWRLVARRDWRAGVILLLILVQVLPWYLIGRDAFFFYALPAVPFIGLALASGSVQAARVRGLRGVPVVVAVAALAMLWWLWPVLTGAELSPRGWELRLLFDSWI